jgi:ketosteroid isomerase-like protein
MRWFAACICFLSICCARGVQAQSADEVAIKRQLAGYAEARQRGDGPGQLNFYSLDADLWSSNTRKIVVGRGEIAKELGRTNRPHDFRLEIENISFLGRDVALVDTQYFGSSPTPHGHAAYLMVKRGDGWLIRAARVFRYPEAPPPPRSQ